MQKKTDKDEFLEAVKNAVPLKKGNNRVLQEGIKPNPIPYKRNDDELTALRESKFSDFTEETILDTDDQKKLIRNIVKGEDLDAKKFSPQLIIYHIDQWKNKGLLPKDVKIEKSCSILKSVLKVYEVYQNKAKDLNAFDFGDLILFCVKLFEDHKDIKEIYRKNF